MSLVGVKQRRFTKYKIKFEEKKKGYIKKSKGKVLKFFLCSVKQKCVNFLKFL